MRAVLPLLLLMLICIGVTNAQYVYPLDYDNLPVFEDTCIVDRNPDHLDEFSGTRKLLWVICAADSGALTPLDYLPHGNGPGNSVNCDSIRVMYPSTYRMPSWATMMFDSTNRNSLTRYFLDQSKGLFRVVGNVVGRNDSTIFLCDPDTAVRPLKCRGTSYYGGYAFFQNIMQKVDSVINFADYTVSATSTTTDFFCFHIYGHSEDCQVEGGGVSAAYQYLSNDTNALGQRIRTGSGVTYWTVSEQMLSLNDDCPYLGAVDSVMAAYWIANGTDAHEFGHNPLGLPHTFYYGSGGEYDNNPYGHVGYGSFDVMGYEAGWPDPENSWAASAPSPYNPYYRESRLGWMNVTTVNQPLQNYVLHDHLTADAVLKIPAGVTSNVNDQYFLAVAATRRSTWDRLWPDAGVMIVHVNPQGFQGNRSKKIFDMELTSGLHDWVLRREPTDPGWHSYLDSLWTGEDLRTENTTTGLDSFDFVWIHTDSFPTKTGYGGPAGNRFNYYLEGDSFDFASNPNSNAHTNSGNWPQNIPTMASLNVVSVDEFNGSCTVNAWGRHWSGAITTSATWLDSVVVDNHLSFAEGTTLAIKPGTKIKISPTANIYISGKIIAEGTAENPIIFECSNPSARWSRLRIYSDDPENVLEHVRISGADYGLFVCHGRLNLYDVTVEDCWVGALFLSASGTTVRYSTFNNNDLYGAWIYNRGIVFDSNTVSGNGVNGIRLWRVPFITLYSNDVADNSSAAYDTADAAGVQILNSTAVLQCNEIPA